MKPKTMRCARCKQDMEEEIAVIHPNGAICEDCFIDLRMPTMGKMMYENHPAPFMLRLKDSFIVCPQRFH